MARLTGICLVSDDVLRLAGFYADLLGCPIEGDADFAWVQAPGARLSVFASSGMTAMAPDSMPGAGRGAMTLEVEVDDVGAAHARAVAADVAVVKAPTTQPWGRESVWLRDPDGNIVNLYRPTTQVSGDRLIRRYFARLFGARDLSVCADMLAPGFVDHDAPPGSPTGPEPTRAYVADMLDRNDAVDVTVGRSVQLGLDVAATVAWDGVARDGSRWRQDGLVLVRFDESGRLRERAATYDRP